MKICSRMNRVIILIALAVARNGSARRRRTMAVRGDQFITMMDGNTLSGTTAAGKAFNIYFLAGGIGSYQEAGGPRDGGSWHLDKDGDVCVAWQNPAERQEGCFRVTVDGREGGLGGQGRQRRGRPCGAASARCF